MKRVKVQYAKTHLSAILAAVEKGEHFIIARGDTDVAHLIPLSAPPDRELGFVHYTLPESFHDPLPEEEIMAWESVG